MKTKDFLIALVIVIIWGANFTVIKLGLDGVPSMLLVALRYIVVAFPAVFFVKKPNTSLKYVIYHGFSIGVGQYACLFYSMSIGMPAGLASIILQLQAFITSLLGAAFLGERLKTKQVVGFVVAGFGLFIIGVASTTDKIASIPLFAIMLTIAAPSFWAISNIVIRKASDEALAKGEKLNMLSLVVWASLIPPIPMIGLALLLDPPSVLIGSLTNLSYLSIFSVLYMGLASTLFGYGFWAILLSKYPLGKVSPLSLLVPITGLFTARIVLGEKLSQMQWIGTGIILLGLIVSNIDVKQIRGMALERAGAR